MRPSMPLSLFSALLLLLVLPQCDWLTSEEKPVEKDAPKEIASDIKTVSDGKPTIDTTRGPVLLSIGGSPKIYQNDFEEYVQEFIKANPQIQQTLQFMPNAEIELFKMMASEIVTEIWAEKTGLDKKADFKNKIKASIEFAKRKISSEFFIDAHPVQVTEADAKKFYDENKSNVRELLLSPGGVVAEGVKFDNEAAARTFLVKAKGATDFATAAKDENLTVQAFADVHEQSFDVEGPIRQRLVELQTFPSTELIKINDKLFWVLKATVKKEPQYVPYTQVKDGIMQVVEQQKLAEEFTKNVEKYKKDYGIVENLAPIEQKVKERQDAQQKMIEQAKQQSEQEKKPGPTPEAPRIPASGNAQSA